MQGRYADFDRMSLGSNVACGVIRCPFISPENPPMTAVPQKRPNLAAPRMTLSAQADKQLGLGNKLALQPGSRVQ